MTVAHDEDQVYLFHESVDCIRASDRLLKTKTTWNFFKDLLIGVDGIRKTSIGPDRPEHHTTGPHIGLRGCDALRERLGCHPAANAFGYIKKDFDF